MEKIYIPTINKYLSKDELKKHIFSKLGKSLREKNILKRKEEIVFLDIDQNTSKISKNYIKKIFGKSKKEIEIKKLECLEKLYLDRGKIYFLPISQEIILFLIVMKILEDGISRILEFENVFLISKYISEKEVSLYLNLEEKYEIFCNEKYKKLFRDFLEILDRNPKYIKSVSNLLKFLNMF